MTPTSKFETVNVASLPVVDIKALRFDMPKAQGIYGIPAENTASFEAKLEKINKRAARISKKAGVAFAKVDFEIVCVAYRTFEVPYPGTSYTMPYYGVKVTGPTPAINGWEFVATLTHVGTGTIVGKVPTVEAPEGFLAKYRDAAPVCDHCGKARNRKDTYVLRNVESKEVKQVGHTCLAEFFPGTSPEAVAELATVLYEATVAAGEEDNEGSWGGRGPTGAETKTFLAYVACAITKCGWVSASMARERETFPTYNVALTYGVFPSPRLPESERLHPTEADIARAQAAIDWATNYFATTDAAKLSDYEHNLKVALSTGWVNHKTFGLVASVIPFAERAIQKVADAKRAAEGRPVINDHFSTIGKRDVFTLTLTSIREWESDFGVTYFHRFVDGEGRVAIWKASKDSGMEVGKTYRVKGTVKAHDEYKGTKQTVLSRCSNEGEVEVEVK